MRLALLCSLLLVLALNAFAQEHADAPPPATRPLLNVQPLQVPPVDEKPAWLPPVAPTPAAPVPAFVPAPDAPPAQTQTPAGTPSTVEQTKTTRPKALTADAPIKKTAKAQQRHRANGTAKQFGAGNNVPPLLAAAAVENESSAQLVSLWRELFPPQQTIRQITATPPLRAGIRSTHAAPPAEESEPLLRIESVLTKKLTPQEEGQKTSDTLSMLVSLVELQKNIKQQIVVTSKKLKTSSSEAEKQTLQEELTKLDKHLSETSADFERIATGVKPDVFSEQKQTSFSWKDELATLLEPSIKELKQLTARARQKSELKDAITGYDKQLVTARNAVTHLTKLIDETGNAKIKTYLGELLPAWQNMEKRISSKLELAQRELAKLENSDVSLFESSSNSMREFFRDRGWYLLIAVVAFVVILLAFRLLARLLLFILPGARKEQRPVHVRILDIFFQFFSVASAICGLIFVLYTAEDWFLLSATIILFLGLAWTVRQTLPKMWQQVRLVLNMGSIREGERIIYQGVPWKVEALNVFCKLSNPALGMHLRIPIEDMVGLISRPYHHDEPWFPCKRGDWVAIEGKPFAKVTSLSHEQVEVVELGGRRITYQTGDFLGMSPANLSRDFCVRVNFGLSYALQAEITTSVVTALQAYLAQKLEEHNLAKDCQSLTVEFLQAGASSLDLVVFANFKGEQAAAFKRIERALNKWCVECCTANGWEIPFPQMTVHLPGDSGPAQARGFHV